MKKIAFLVVIVLLFLLYFKLGNIPVYDLGDRVKIKPFNKVVPPVVTYVQDRVEEVVK